MSSIQNEAVDSLKNQENIAHEIAEILRQDYKSSDSPIKRIHHKTGLSTHAIRNWYEAQRVPSLKSFIHLTKASPKLLECVLRKADQNALEDIFIARNSAEKSDTPISNSKLNRLVFETKNSTDILKTMQKLKLRQLWFYGQIQQGEILRGHDLMHAFDVPRATAYRDIEELIAFNLICSVGEGHARYYAAME